MKKVIRKQFNVNKPKRVVKNDFQHYDIIKSVSVFEKGKYLYLDIYLKDGFEINGKRRLRPSTGEEISKRNRQRVERDKYALALNYYLSKGNLSSVDKSNLTLDEVAIKALTLLKGDRSHDAQIDSENIYKNFIKPILGDLLIQDVRLSHLKKWKSDLLEEKTLSRSRYLKYHTTLKAIFDYAFTEEILDGRNPIDYLDKKSKKFKPSSNSVNKFYSKDEVKQMLEASTGWFKAYLTLLFNTGMRTAESLGLHWDDIDFDRQIITISRGIRHGKVKRTKTNIINEIDMNESLTVVLKEYKEIAIFKTIVFPNPRTGRYFYEPKPVRELYFNPLLESLGIENKTLYATRHTYASLLVKENVDITYVQRQLGHTNLQTTLSFYIRAGLMAKSDRNPIVDRLYT